jgi:hypothetical protein
MSELDDCVGLEEISRRESQARESEISQDGFQFSSVLFGDVDITGKLWVPVKGNSVAAHGDVANVMRV